MSVLVSGSVAYDTVMVFPGQFKDHILPEQVHMLSVSFLVPQLRRNFGGCAGNIAFNLQLLGVKAQIVATVGDDFGPYAEWLHQHQISTQGIQTIAGTYTAQAFITTDQSDNQITAFHPGAMQHSGELALPKGTYQYALVGPDSKLAMTTRLQQLHGAGIPAIFDPGQGLPMFNGDELKAMIGQARLVIVNDYEAKLLEERTGWQGAQVSQHCEAYIITRGSDGSTIHTQRGQQHIPVVSAAAVVDPTGCGDAFRGGLLAGLVKGFDLLTAARVGSIMGAIKIAHSGTQTHQTSWADVASRYATAFGQALPVSMDAAGRG
jgi:adenosine kinase